MLRTIDFNLVYSINYVFRVHSKEFYPVLLKYSMSDVWKQIVATNKQIIEFSTS